MQTRDIAILVVEFQKTWTQDSFFHRLIKKEYHSRRVYANSIALLDAARAYQIPIIQSPFIIDKSHKEIYSKIPFLPKFLGQFKANTWRAEYTDGIYKESDYEVTGRTAFDNTIDSNLLDILKELDTKTVYIMGFTTDHCVTETIDSLMVLGYEVVLVSDATATFKHATQRKIEERYTSIDSNSLIESVRRYLYIY